MEGKGILMILFFIYFQVFGSKNDYFVIMVKIFIDFEKAHKKNKQIFFPSLSKIDKNFYHYK